MAIRKRAEPVKIGLLVEIESSESQEDVSSQLSRVLGDAGFKVTVTWPPDLSDANSRLQQLCADVKKIGSEIR